MLSSRENPTAAMTSSFLRGVRHDSAVRLMAKSVFPAWTRARSQEMSRVIGIPQWCSFHGETMGSSSPDVVVFTVCVLETWRNVRRSSCVTPGKTMRSTVLLRRQKCSFTVVTVFTVLLTHPPRISVTVLLPESRSLLADRSRTLLSQAAKLSVTTLPLADQLSSCSLLAAHQPGVPAIESKRLMSAAAAALVVSSASRNLSS
mmetsp:Transcript_44039/g.125633  ORF Transcript_44039/g.125633 Transcript_44039/m.125633 type:complete len:203 (-) Transcript_44039:68-676(-)